MLSQVREIHAPKGVEVVGIGVDSAVKVSEFLKQHLVAYPVLVAGMGAIDLMRSLGNSAGALPFTVVLDRPGNVAYRRLGILSRQELEGVLAGLLR